MLKKSLSYIVVAACMFFETASAGPEVIEFHTYTGTASGTVLAVSLSQSTSFPFDENISFVVGDDRSFVFSVKGRTFQTDIKKNGNFSGSLSFDIIDGLCNVTVDVAGSIIGKNASGTLTGSGPCGDFVLTLNSSTFTASSPTEPSYLDTRNQPKVAVIPSGDDFIIIPLTSTGTSTGTPAGVVLEDSLLEGTSIGSVTGGVFGSKGWTHRTGEEKIIWDLGPNNTIEAGIIEFEITGIHNGTQGGWTQATKQRAYYFGFYNHTGIPIGNKLKGGNNPAFIEVRYNWGSSYAPLSAIKFQAGDAGLSGTNHEPFGKKPWRTWNANTVYKHRITFGDGLTKLYINDVFQAKVNYVNRPLGWRYLFVGDLNYPIGGPNNVTYRNIKITKIK